MTVTFTTRLAEKSGIETPALPVAFRSKEAEPSAPARHVAVQASEQLIEQHRLVGVGRVQEIERVVERSIALERVPARSGPAVR